MVDDAGVAVHAAAVVGRALVLGVGHLAGVAEARGVPHVADRPAEGRRLLADQPAEGVVARAAGVLHGDVDRSPAARAVRIDSRSVSPMLTRSTRSEVSAPDMPIGASSRLPMISAAAPAACGDLGLLPEACTDHGRPCAILPATAAALVYGEQPSVVVPAGSASAGSATSVATTTLPVMPAAVSGSPNDAPPVRHSLAIDDGALIVSSGSAPVCVEQSPTGRDGVDVALAFVLAAVDEVDGLTPHVGEALVHRTGLPLVDQARRVLGVGVTPLVGHDVVGRHPVAVVGRHAVPVGVRALDARVVVDR